MRVTRLLALAIVALVAPLSRGSAQTCQGTAAFQDGRARVGVDDQYNSDFNDGRASFAYGAPRSFYGGVSIDGLQVNHAVNSMFGVGANLGYQIHLSDTPFQFCPEIWGHYAAGKGSNAQSQVAFGGSLGYRVGVSDWLTLVPAAGIWWISTSTADMIVTALAPSSGPSATSAERDNGTSSQVLMTLGLVFNKAFTISPSVFVPSQTGAKVIYAIGVSINWANAVSR
jgi:hypothetical protein